MSADLIGYDMAAIRAANAKATILTPAELDAMTDDEHFDLALDMHDLARRRFFAATIDELAAQVPEYLEIKRKERGA